LIPAGLDVRVPLTGTGVIVSIGGRGANFAVTATLIVGTINVFGFVGSAGSVEYSHSTKT
jgi:hypothetical protein